MTLFSTLDVPLNAVVTVYLQFALPNCKICLDTCVVCCICFLILLIDAVDI